MKMIAVVVLAVVAIASAIPVQEAPVEILRSNFDHQPDGAYDFGFEASNGIQRQETGELKQTVDEDNKPKVVVVVRGSYSYPDGEGKPINIVYFADENGYRAEGDSIPTPSSRR